VDRIAADELLAGLLVVHGLHPYDVTERVERALESVRPYLRSHGGDVELLEVAEHGDRPAALLGHCDGCAGSTATLRSAVDGAIEAAAPEVVRIDVEEPTAPLHPGADRRLRPGGLDHSPDRRMTTPPAVSTVLARIRSRPRRRGASSARCAASRSRPRRMRTWSTWATGRCCAPAGHARCCSPTRTRSCATRWCRTNGPRSRRCHCRLWDDLQIPVGVAFFFTNSELGRVVGVYPGPAGATESELTLAAWDAGAGGGPRGRRAGAGRRGAAGPGDRGPEWTVSWSRSTLLRAGRPAAAALARLRRRPGRAPRADAFFERVAGRCR
jgi:Fe-S cluster biogenesis protein NfuA